MPSRKPSFFIIGAPKCGTTSLSTWLSEHPDVFMCQPKEPYFFCSDIRYSISVAKDLEEYEQLFGDAREHHVAVGEASTTYLRSKVAVPKIRELYPDAVFIVCLRNPVEMVASVHAQLYQGTVETEKSLAKAWRLQELRRKGKSLPSFCPAPEELQYAKSCLLGAQVERYLEHVPESKTLFIFLDDLRSSPKEQYQRILEFLQLRDDDRETFPVINQRSVPKIGLIRLLLSRGNYYKSKIGISHSFGIGTLMRRINTQKIDRKKAEFDPDFSHELKTYFKDDIEKLSKLTDRDLSNWL